MSRVFTLRLPVLSALLAGFLLSSAVLPAAAARRRAPQKHEHATHEPPTERSAAHAPNPLLPVQIRIDDLHPDLVVPQKTPEMVPAGLKPLYTAADWDAFRNLFGSGEDVYLRLRSSGRAELAGKMTAAAAAHADQPGLQRLLLVRAVAVAYRQRDGTDAASAAIRAYRAAMDTTDLAQAAAYYAITEAMTRYASTPKDVRLVFSAEAARANIQLAMLLVDAGQIDAAQQVIHRLGRHEVAIRHDAKLSHDAAIARDRVADTAAMMDYLAEQVRALPTSSGPAAMPLYLYARIIKPTPAIVDQLVARPDAVAVAHLEHILDEANMAKDGPFFAGQALRAAANNLPDGLLKDRTLYAAWEYYHTYMNGTKDGGDRVKRTLSRMAMQDVIVDGAHRPWTLRPLDETTSTQASTPTSATNEKTQ